VDNQESQISLPELQITEFQKLLIFQIFRPDLLMDIIGRTTTNLLGMQNSLVGQSHIKQLLNESSNSEPILIVATSGTDPTSELKEIAKNSIGINNFTEIYVGKGQENHLDLIKSLAESNNQWVCVKNIHLMPHFIAKIENKLKTAKLDAGFKMIYVCESDANISKSFLNKCKKLLIEPPNGIKYKICNLMEHYQSRLKDTRDYKNIKLFVALFALHSVLQERRTFIPQGWCKWYEFCDADLKAAIDFITTISKIQTQKDDWTVLKGLIEKIVYGGRVDNNQDFGKLVHLIDEYFDIKILNAKWAPKPFNVSLSNWNNFDDYYNSFIKMENFDSRPEMFGLSSLSSVSRNITACRNLLKDMRKIYFNIDDSENYDKRIKPLINLWRKLANVRFF
jgi:dynein heavy chain 2